MTAIRSLIFPLIVVASSLLLSACYTLLKHPTVDTAAYEEVRTNACTSCHYEEDLWYYHHSPAHRLYPGSSFDNWRYYYAVPWWYDSYWRYPVEGGSSTAPLPSREVRPSIPKERDGGAIGGPVLPPPDPKSTGTPVRIRQSDEDSKKDGDKKPNDGEIKKRDVRPKINKEKPKAKDKNDKDG